MSRGQAQDNDDEVANIVGHDGKHEEVGEGNVDGIER